MNKKAFTLIELLAVIIILGVLLLIAVPSVTKYITNSKIDTYEKNLAKLVDAVVTDVNSGNSDYNFGSDEYLIVPLSSIEVERGSNLKSPFGEYIDEQSFVVITKKLDNTGYNYYVNAADTAGYGTIGLYSSDNIQVGSKNDIAVAAINNSSNYNVSYLFYDKWLYELQGINNNIDELFVVETTEKTAKLASNYVFNSNSNILSIDDIKIGDFIEYTPIDSNLSDNYSPNLRLDYVVYEINKDDNYIKIIPTVYDYNITIDKTNVGQLDNISATTYGNSLIGATATSLDVDSSFTKLSGEWYGIPERVYNSPTTNTNPNATGVYFIFDPKLKIFEPPVNTNKSSNSFDKSNSRSRMLVALYNNNVCGVISHDTFIAITNNKLSELSEQYKCIKITDVGIGVAIEIDRYLFWSSIDGAWINDGESILKANSSIETISNGSYHLMPIIEIPINNVKFKKETTNLSGSKNGTVRQIISIEKK